jgi:hypothetical protein
MMSPVQAMLENGGWPFMPSVPRGWHCFNARGAYYIQPAYAEVLHVRVGIDAGGHIINADEE